MSSQITLAAPRLGAEEGVGRTGKKEANKSRDHPEPSTERGGSVGRKKAKRRNQTAQPSQTRNALNPDLKIQKTPEPLKEKDTDHKTQKAPEITQGEKPRSQDAEITRSNPRRKTQKTGKLSSAAAA